MDERMKHFAATRIALTCLGCAAICLYGAEMVNAAVAFGEIGQNVAENAKGVAKGAQYAGFAGGVIMAVLGITDMYKASKGNGQHTYQAGIVKVLAGGLLLGIGAFLGSGSATLFGSDQTSGLGDFGL